MASDASLRPGDSQYAIETACRLHAEALALNIFERKLGPEHPHTAICRESAAGLEALAH